jgi:hypothetical protein
MVPVLIGAGLVLALLVAIGLRRGSTPPEPKPIHPQAGETPCRRLTWPKPPPPRAGSPCDPALRPRSGVMRRSVVRFEREQTDALGKLAPLCHLVPRAEAPGPCAPWGNEVPIPDR